MEMEMEQSGSGHSSVTGPSARTTVALEFDLNKTPPPSPTQEEETAGGNDDGAKADLRCASCRHTQGEMVVCVVCVKHFHVECLGGSVEESEWKCAECSTECRRRKRFRRSATAASGGGRLGLMDMNASPPLEVDGDDVGVYVNSDLAMTDSSSKMQDTCGNPLLGSTSTSSNTRTDIRIAQLNLDIATQNANSVYLQALRDYISEKRGILGDGWRVKFEYFENSCKTFPIYCAPDGSIFDSMPKVAHYLGLLSASCSFETNGNDSSIELLQKGSHATKYMADSSRSLSRVINGGNAVEVDPNESGDYGRESFLDGFPVQFEDFFVTSIGKIDPRLPFHNASQIWPIGYKSVWHDKLTGSIFVCNVFKDGDCGLKFRVNRYPCTKQSLPKASTIIYKPKCGPSDEMTSCLTSESSIFLKKCQHIPSDNFINDDVVGEFSVEGRSPSSAWQMVLETLLLSCRQSFQDLKYLNFCCNHSTESQNFYGSYGIDSLDKFGYMPRQTTSIPSLILTVDQLELSCMVLRRWLQPDRFGLDAEFVQELIEKLPEASACSEYKYLDARCQNPISHSVKGGFFTVLRKYHSQPMVVSDSLIESGKRLAPPGNAIVSKLPPALIGNVLQAYEFFLRFHTILGQEAHLSRQKLEYELLNPWINGLNSPNSGSMESCEKSHKMQDLTSCFTVAPASKARDKNCAETKESEGVGCQSLLSNFLMAILKVVVEDMLAKVMVYDPSGAMESKSRKVRKKNVDLTMFDKRVKIGIFPVNDITWPEIARRYILVLLSMDDNPGDLDITSREFNEVFHCLNGGGGPICGSLLGMAAIEADAVALAEASKTVFSSVKSKLVDFVIDRDLIIHNSAIERKIADNKCPEWIEILEPVRKQATNVGAKIRNLVRQSLQKRPPAWAKTMLQKSISKDIYKGNAAGPTKRIVLEVLHKVRNENPLTKKKAKESRVVRTVSDVIIKRCRMVLRSVAAEDENKAFFNLMSESLVKPNNFDNVGHPATVSRPLDFRTIDLRLDVGSYRDSHESFIEDVREVWQNLRIIYRNKRGYLDMIEKISRRLEELFEQEVLALVSKITEYENRSSSSSDETKTEINMMLADTISSTLFVAPWEDGICKVCGKDENDHILLLCDRCDAEYHTYCLDPPLQRVPKSSWYCPPCISFITSQTMPREEDFDSPVLSQPPLKKKGRKEVTQNGLEELANLADNMESTEYWELGLEERVFLLQFLCDEALSSTIIRDHISSDNHDIKRNFLGQDSAGRLYWVLGQPERLFVSGPHSEGEVCLALENYSSSSEFDSWMCYELDAEVEALVEWLKDADAREKQLKERITNWQRNKSNNHNGQFDLQVDLRPMVYVTNARAELKKKFGSFLEGKIPCLKNGGTGKVIHEGNIYRCDCLELVGPTRHHCFSCHTTFFANDAHCCTQRTLTLTNELVRSNGNLPFVPEDPPQNNNAVFLFQKLVNSNGSTYDVGRSNPEGTGNNNDAAFLFKQLVKSNGSTSEVGVSNPEGITGNNNDAAFLFKQLVKSNGSTSEVGVSNPEGITGNNNEAAFLFKQLVKSNGSTSEVGVSNPEGVTGNNNDAAFLFKQLVKSNGSTSEVGGSNPERIIGNNNDTAFLFKELVKSNGSTSEVGRSNPEGITRNSPSSSRPLDSRVSEIIQFLKIVLFDIEFALPKEAYRSSRVDSHRLQCWRAFLKSAESIHEMVQATIVLEDMIKSEYLKKEWWYWSSPSTAAKISTTSALALQIYALDAAIYYSMPPLPLPSVDMTVFVTPEDYKSMEEAPIESNLSSSTNVAPLNDPEHSKTPRSKDKSMKKKLKLSSD